MTLAGCNTLESTPEFEVHELDGRNTIDEIFAEYSSVRTVSNYYGMNGEDFTQTMVHVKRDNGISAHVEFDFPDSNSGYTIESDGIYYYQDDGTYGKYAFFNDGYFETYYLNSITKRVVHTPIEAETLISDTVEGNVRTLVYNSNVSDNSEMCAPYEVYDGIMETIYEYDANTGFLIGKKYYLTPDGGETKLASDRTLTYGQHDDFPEPEYTVRAKDTSDTRIVRFVMQDGEVFTHTIPRDSILMLLSMEEHGYFEDPEFTIPYQTPEDGYPDETTVYVQTDFETPGLVIYTSMKDSLIVALVDDFKAKNPDIAVNVVIDGAGNLMSKIESERQEGQISADLIWTSEIPDFYDMKDEGLLMQYTPNGADDIFNPLEGTDGYFIPARLGTMGIAYNTELIETPPESWRDLLGEDYKGGFVFANPETSGTALMAVTLLTEEFGADFFSELRSNGAFVGQGSSWVVDSVASGEITAGLAVDYITFDKAKSGEPIAMFYPQEMIVIPSPVAIFKDSANTLAAQMFVDYLITPDAQRLIKDSGTLPVLGGIPAPGEYNIPPVAEAMERAIVIDESDMMNWKDDVVKAFLDIMRSD